MKTYGDLFGGIWHSDGRFDHRASVEIDDSAILRIAQLALVGWTFCGVTGDLIELERGNEIATISRLGADNPHGVCVRTLAE